jgi:hypothetical protein
MATLKSTIAWARSHATSLALAAVPIIVAACNGRRRHWLLARRAHSGESPLHVRVQDHLELVDDVVAA